MKVNISVGGRFHAFYLAQQLLKKGYLGKLITSYPRFEVEKYGIPSKKIESVVVKEILERGWRKLPGFVRSLYNPQFFIHELFDRSAAKKIDKSDIFVGFSSFSSYSLRKAKELGAVTVLERGSPHILFQHQLAQREYQKLGLVFKEIHPKVIDKELEEYKQADYISIPSLFVKRTFLEQGIPEEKLICVPYGVDLSEFRQVPKEDNIFRVVYAGGIKLEKGIHYLLQAFSELKLPDSELLLIGALNDDMKPFFKKYKGRYNWIGRKPQKELYRHYSQGSVFVMPSLQEGFGMVILQAMACGLPVICTENTGAPDTIEEGKDGFVIPICDVEAIKKKILAFYRKPELVQEMGRVAKEKMNQDFSWDNYGEKMIKEYIRILSLKR